MLTRTKFRTLEPLNSEFQVEAMVRGIRAFKAGRNMVRWGLLRQFDLVGRRARWEYSQHPKHEGRGRVLRESTRGW